MDDPANTPFDPKVPPSEMQDFAKRMFDMRDARNMARAEGGGISGGGNEPLTKRTIQSEPPIRRFEPVTMSERRRTEVPLQTSGRFTVSLSDEKLYFSDGCVAKTDPDDLAEWFSKQVVPGFPDLDGAPLNSTDPRKYISVSGLSTTQDYEARWVDSGDFGELVVEEDTETREEDFLVIATFTLKLSSGKKVFDEFSQLWNSDIAWSESASKSSSSSKSESSGSSEPSSGSEPSESQGSGSAPSEGSTGSPASDGSSKDSAVVPHPTKRGLFMKFFTEESTNVPFNFFIRCHITRPVTRCRIDDRYFLACEPGTVRVRCTNGPSLRSVGGDVQGNEVVLYAGPKKGRPEWVDVSFTGDRKGFPRKTVEWMEADYIDFAENERRLNPRFVPNPVLLRAAGDLRKASTKRKPQ